MRITCTKCKLEKDETDFYNDKRRGNGKGSWCKKCINSDNIQRHKIRYKNDPAYRKKINNNQKCRYWNARKDAGLSSRHKLSIEHTVTAMKKHIGGNHSIKTEISKNPCVVLKAHAIVMKDDPERLTTKFLQNLIGRSCNLNENKGN